MSDPFCEAILHSPTKSTFYTIWQANNVMAWARIIQLQPVVLQYSASDITSWYTSSANVPVLLRNVPATSLSLGQSNKTQQLCILPGKSPKLWFMKSLTCWSGHTNEIWSLSTCPTHQGNTEEICMFLIFVWSHRYFSCALSGRKFERCPLQLINH